MLQLPSAMLHRFVSASGQTGEETYDRELFLNGHDDLDGVEAVEAEVVDECRSCANLG